MQFRLSRDPDPMLWHPRLTYSNQLMYNQAIPLLLLGKINELLNKNLLDQHKMSGMKLHQMGKKPMNGLFQHHLKKPLALNGNPNLKWLILGADKHLLIYSNQLLNQINYQKKFKYQQRNNLSQRKVPLDLLYHQLPSALL
jgi:hypothetical protein